MSKNRTKFLRERKRRVKDKIKKKENLMLTLKNNNAKMKKCLTPREFFEKLYGQSNSKNTQMNNNCDIINNNIVNNESREYQVESNNTQIQTAVLKRKEDIEIDNEGTSRTFHDITEDQKEVPGSVDTLKKNRLDSPKPINKKEVRDVVKGERCEGKLKEGLEDVFHLVSHRPEAICKDINTSETLAIAHNEDFHAPSSHELKTIDETPKGLKTIDEIPKGLETIDEISKGLETIEGTPKGLKTIKVTPKTVSLIPNSSVHLLDDSSDEESPRGLEILEDRKKISSSSHNSLPSKQFRTHSSDQPKSGPNIGGSESKVVASSTGHLTNSLFNFHHHPPQHQTTYLNPHMFPPGVPPGQLPIALSAFRK